jgi:hypothetical protein
MTTGRVRRRQTVERKARFIGQVMRGRLDVREIEDVGDTALSYSEVKALATGDPRILEKARVDAELARLERLERAHARNQRTLAATIDKAEKALPTLERAREQIQDAIGRRVDTSGDRFAMTVNGTRWTARADAAIALRNALAAIRPDSDRDYDKPTHVATVAGFDVIATARRYLEPHFTLELDGVPRSNVSVNFDELRSDRPLGIVIKLENRAADLERTRAKLIDEADTLAREAARARDDSDQPFPRRDALLAVRARSGELATELAEQDKQRDPVPAAQRRPPPTEHHAARAETTSAVSGRCGRADPPRSPAEHAQMAKDTAAATFAARTPIERMDRPSVERELRHVHGDTIYYTTAHAARDALAAARATADPDRNASRTSEHVDARNDRAGENSLERTPPGGWTADDRVPPPQPPDTSQYPSAQRYPIGTPLTVHAIGADGPGRQLGHGIVVDHPGPAHVIVESPYGTRRISPISHVRPTVLSASTSNPTPPSSGHPPSPTDRWRHLFATQPAVLDDPHWPALAAQMDRIAGAGADVAALVDQIIAERALPADHPARSLDYRLSNAVPPPPTTHQGSGTVPAAGEDAASPAPDAFTRTPPARRGPGR